MVSLIGKTSLTFRINKKQDKIVTIGISGEVESSLGILGTDPLDWSCIATGHIWHDWNNTKSHDLYCDSWNENDMITVIVDREVGTLSYKVNGDDKGIAYSDD